MTECRLRGRRVLGIRAGCFDQGPVHPTICFVESQSRFGHDGSNDGVQLKLVQSPKSELRFLKRTCRFLIFFWKKDLVATRSTFCPTPVLTIGILRSFSSRATTWLHVMATLRDTQKEEQEVVSL